MSSVSLTDTRGDGRAALLVALGTAVAGDPRDAVLAGALTRCLVARFARRSNRMAVTRWEQRRGEKLKEAKLNYTTANGL